MPHRAKIQTVSAVIPTRTRFRLLQRAVSSALAQSHPPVEVIVVIDGPDSETEEGLAKMGDSRVRVIALDNSVGAAEARNVGVRQASGEWIAFLDDDDEWLPNKLYRQLAAIEGSSDGLPVVASKVLARNGHRDDIWPLTPPSKPYSEYLLVRRRLRFGEGIMQTSTLMAKRELLTQVPFRAGLRKHQDWDWILRCTEVETFRVVFVEEALAIWHLDENRVRVSRQDDWRVSLAWIRNVRHLVTKRAYASFLSSYVSRQAAAAGAWKSAYALASEMVQEGQPVVRDFVLLILPWLLPANMLQFIRSAVNRHSPTDTPPLVGKEI